MSVEFVVFAATQMVQDLTAAMFEVEGEPKTLKNEIGHLFLIDRGNPLLLIWFVVFCSIP